ncbi:MAG TPA: DNA polymerase III subunit beta [Anaerovoracaceae bacterium]|nr:DNA polymerase III subunit beta [Anaerovoracaceae bacterium]
MKFNCNQSILSKTLNIVSKAVPTRTTSKIMEGILIVAKDNKLILSATDTNILIEETIYTEVIEEGEVVIPSKLFTNIIRMLPNENVLIHFNEVTKEVNVDCKNSTSKIVGFSSDEYPKIKTEDINNEIKIEKELFKNMVQKTAFSASVEESKGVLTGILIEINENEIKMVAIDGFRMAINKSNIEGKNITQVIVPAKLLLDVSKIINTENDNKFIEVKSNDNKIIIIFDNTKVIINLLNGEFIKYNNIIPKNSDISIRVIKNDLSESIERAAILTNEQNHNLIKFKIEDKEMELTSLSEIGKINEKVEIIKDGPDIEIGFNSRYLIDLLKVIEDEEIMIHMTNSVSPCLIKPLTGEKYVYLILPVRIN